jgi:chromosome segregation ATPase
MLPWARIEREVKKATRDLNQLLNNIESPMTRLETVHKKYTELLADMKKLDRDYTKSKKRADQLQKEQDKGKSEMNKTATMKEKLEKLCRELTKENKKVKVGLPRRSYPCCYGEDESISDVFLGYRTRIRNSKIRRRKPVAL